MRLDTALAAELAAVPKRVLVAQWIASYDAAGRENGRKLPGAFEGDHPDIGRLRLDLSLLGGRKSSYQVSMSILGRKTRHPIYRIDLWPGRHHNNPVKQNDPDSRRRFGPMDGHIHDFQDAVDLTRPDDFARPIPASVVDFRAAVSHLCVRMNVTNADDIPDPLTQGILL